MTENQKRRMNDLLEANRQRELEPDEAAPATATVLTDDQILEAVVHVDPLHYGLPKDGPDYIGYDLACARLVESEVLAHASKGEASIEGLTRYDPANGRGEDDAYMFPIPFGDYVKFADVERLLAQAGVRAEPAKKMPDSRLQGILLAASIHPNEPYVRAAARAMESALAAPTIPAQVPAAEVRAQALREAAELCASIYQNHRDQYKGRGKYAPPADNPRRADPHCDGCADGAAECEEAIRSLAQSSTADKASEVRAAEWISTKDELPKDGEMVRIFCPDPYPETWESPWVESQQAFVSNVHGWVGKDEVPYWHRLPAAPAVDGQQGGGGA